MKSDVETLSPTRVKLTVEVPFDELKPSLDAAYSRIAKQVSPDIHVTVGGPHAISFPDEAIRLEFVDSIVVDRDAEVTFAEWVDALAGRRPRHDVAGVCTIEW